MVNNTPLVLTLPDILELRTNAAIRNQRLVLTNGCFDILHRGHLKYLFESAELGDLLVVAVNSDDSVKALKGPSRPINSQGDRAFAVASLKCVTATFVFDGPQLDMEIRMIRPDYYTKAGDYSIETLNRDELSALQAVGADIRLMPFVQGVSTTQIIDRISPRH